MDDMFGDAFGSSAPAAAASTDPAADFLAGEQVPDIPRGGRYSLVQASLAGTDLGLDLGLSPAPPAQNGLDGTMDFFVGNALVFHNCPCSLYSFGLPGWRWRWSL